MDRARTLPPFVKGKVRATLNFHIDRIRLDKFMCSTSVFQVFVLVQWWGETETCVMRPKELDVIGLLPSTEQVKSFSTNELNFQQLYNIRAHMDIFKYYLKCCDRLELIILNSLNHIIGSTVVIKISEVVFQKTVMNYPIINYSGNKIGEINLTFDIQDIYNDSMKQYSNEEFSEGQDNPKPTKESEVFETLNTNDYDVVNIGKNVSPHLMKRELYKFSSMKNIQNSVTSKISTSTGHHHRSIGRNKNEGQLQKLNKKLENDLVTQAVKEYLKPSPRTLSEISNEISDINQKLLNPQRCKESKTGLANKDTKTALRKSSKLKIMHEHTHEPKIILKDRSERVLDYLLGRDMSKEDESKAVEYLKLMSPSHDLVQAMNEMYQDEKNYFQNSVSPTVQVQTHTLEEYFTKHHFNSGSPLQVASIKYNLDDPVEKLYYETFIKKLDLVEVEAKVVSNEKQREYEVVEFLNKPEFKHLIGQPTVENKIMKERAYESKFENYDKEGNTSQPQTSQSGKCATCIQQDKMLRIKQLEKEIEIIRKGMYDDKFDNEQHHNSSLELKMASESDLEQNFYDNRDNCRLETVTEESGIDEAEEETMCVDIEKQSNPGDIYELTDYLKNLLMSP